MYCSVFCSRIISVILYIEDVDLNATDLTALVIFPVILYIEDVDLNAR